MPTKAEKERRKKLHRELAQKEQEEFFNNLPTDKDVILELFDFLDSELGERDCNHDYQLTEEFLKSKNIVNEKIFDWFREQGGYCDCEILFNIEERFEK
ncbi:DUF2695 domain-containing protein [Gaoshiqia sediminis]|uniref:DUF2695 domain-containing protein n=1 Tax=Gaoshiqia sediminis TaxID=2986998 RepID=A0AA41Y8F2_9BACT|nr:DUF2695 domain-containing protein [Gaoshiqia sediminis]MCW0481090.1 DUF2695 domain-containing protein [Gaoshiqia sediminis]